VKAMQGCRRARSSWSWKPNFKLFHIEDAWIVPSGHTQGVGQHLGALANAAAQAATLPTSRCDDANGRAARGRAVHF
jgi:hypothetical protein